MKIKRINNYSTALHFTFACSQCEAEVGSRDRFCYNCGHKLSALPDEMKKQEAADILTDVLRKKPVAPAKTDERGLVVRGSDVNLHCIICGKSSPENCEHLRKSGACDAMMCTSNPPQYRMCTFRGDGFIPITEA